MYAGNLICQAKNPTFRRVAGFIRRMEEIRRWKYWFLLRNNLNGHGSIA